MNKTGDSCLKRKWSHHLLEDMQAKLCYKHLHAKSNLIIDKNVKLEMILDTKNDRLYKQFPIKLKEEMPLRV